MTVAAPFSRRQRAALTSICDTFFPAHNGVPSASALGVVDALLDAVAANPRAAERRQFAQLLNIWDTSLLTALGGGGLRRFSELDQAQREAVLLSWCDSRIPQRRAAFQALRKGSLIIANMLPNTDGSANPAWAAMGFPGPLGKRADAAPKPLKPIEIAVDTDLTCDVVIVGSGAGGGTSAGVLAAAGLDVVVMEMGGYYDDADFDGSELTALGNFYLSAPQASADQSVSLLAGSCLGGGTVVNYSTSFRTPDDVRAEWANHGVPAFAGEEYTLSLDAVVDRLGVNLDHNKPSAREEVLRNGCDALGWPVDAMPRNVRGCDQGVECGYCGLGCRIGAKQSVTKTWLADAADAGARLVINTRVERVIIESGAARGVEARTVDGRRVTVRSRAVVVACGALHTPALLRRSGLENANIGKHLKLHPIAPAIAVFDQEIRAWEGVMQALYSDQHRNLDNGYGVKYETPPTQPHIINSFVPWRGASMYRELIEAYPYLTGIGGVVRDRDGGEVRVGRDGEPVVHYHLSDYDLGHLRTGIDGAAQILEAAGAKRIFSSHSRWVSYEPGSSGDRVQFMADCDAAGYGPGQISMGSFHIMGSARMGGAPTNSVCDPTGQTWDVRDLLVCDGSAFPTASGVNPMISIEAIAHMNARGLAARLA
ncbi:GMC family oxidoreductase N-terminal domain-containing protein [Mycolicibacterium sp. CBMA 226]|uniref:GMC family oxidoreductase N-terminal domain-containing protein n=1 Tax=Mycolicibacterium sp. CBMA 226 TaxID=2606611 RepID=UPI0012DCD591|nr:GMC family oxidoreductase N-terminal domain-containing protein [Mycolicibacterium sp. CBMA 226]MUL75148.1 FAD-binding protein [Mycolicibacterium sp. CBMA 226]